MASAADILGTLDVLEKSGEVSPDYAAGVRSVLEKQAFAGLGRLARFAIPAAKAIFRHPVRSAVVGGTAYGAQKLQDMGQYDRFNETLRERNLERGGSNGEDGKPVDIRLTRRDTTDALAAARPWHDNLFRRLWNATYHRGIRPMASALPGNPKTWDQYQIDYENRVRADEQDYLTRSGLEGRAGGPLGQWAMADIHARHSDAFNDLATGAKSWMPASQREALGLPEKPVNMYQTPYTQSAVDHGLYKLQHDYGKKPTRSGYGGSGMSEYGEVAPNLRSDLATLPPRRI